MKPTTWSVKLICCRTIFTWLKTNCNYLLGAFLYGIVEDGGTEAVLELYRGYDNLSGFISYTKLGFNVDFSLYRPNCFSLISNLPMISTLPSYGKDMVVECVRQTDAAQDFLKHTIRDPTGIFFNRAHIIPEAAPLGMLIYKMTVGVGSHYTEREERILSQKGRSLKRLREYQAEMKNAMFELTDRASAGHASEPAAEPLYEFSDWFTSEPTEAAEAAEAPLYDVEDYFPKDDKTDYGHYSKDLIESEVSPEEPANKRPRRGGKKTKKKKRRISKKRATVRT